MIVQIELKGIIQRNSHGNTTLHRKKPGKLKITSIDEEMTLLGILSTETSHSNRLLDGITHNTIRRLDSRRGNRAHGRLGNVTSNTTLTK